MRVTIIRITAFILTLAIILICAFSPFLGKKPSEEEQPAAEEPADTHATVPARHDGMKNTTDPGFEKKPEEPAARSAAPQTSYTAAATARDIIQVEKPETIPTQDKVSVGKAASPEDGAFPSLAKAEETAPPAAEKDAGTACGPETSAGAAEVSPQAGSGVSQACGDSAAVPAPGTAAEDTTGDAGQPGTGQSDAGQPDNASGPEEGRYATLVLTDSDLELLARLVYLEARGEPYEGQVAVAEVVLNRVLSDRFPDTVEEVIYQTGQFTPASRLESTTPGEDQYKAVADAVDGETCVTGANVVFFSGAPYNDRVYAVIGNHYFCEL